MSTLFKCMCSQTKVSDVHVLDYRHNGLLEVPGGVFLHERSLDTLHLDSNRISDLPRELFSCVGLRKLTLSDNDVQLLPPAIGSLINLEHLDCSKNAIIELPDNIKCLKHLHTLDLSVNPLGRLPDGFTQLFNLTQLFLNDCFIEYLPGSFGRLTKLKVLELRENKLKTLPASISRLSELERLDLGNNEFQELPPAMGSMTALAELWCDHNKLRMLPVELGNCRQLMYLDASENQLQWLPAEIDGCAALSDLHLSQNRLQELPETLGKLGNLTTLKADQNRLKLLPFSIGGLLQLVELNVSKNELEELPPTIGLLRNLRTFYADENFLVELPPELGSCSSITVLSLRSNQLSLLPDELGRIHQLRVLNVSQNLIRYLPLSFTKLKSLQALWLADNQSQPLLKLQTDFDAATRQKVLTCYLLPQVSNEESSVPQRQPPPSTSSMRRMPTLLTPIDENPPSMSLGGDTVSAPKRSSSVGAASRTAHIHFGKTNGDSSEHSRRGATDPDAAPLPKDVSDRHSRNAQLIGGRPTNSTGNSPHNTSPTHANGPGPGPVAAYPFIPAPQQMQSNNYPNFGVSSSNYAFSQPQPQAVFFGNPHAQLARSRSASRERERDREENPATCMFNDRVRNGLSLGDNGEVVQEESDARRVAGRREIGTMLPNSNANSVWVRQDATSANGRRPQRPGGAMRGYESDSATVGIQMQMPLQPPHWNANVPTAMLSNMHGAQVRAPFNSAWSAGMPNPNSNSNSNSNFNASGYPNPPPRIRPLNGSGYASDSATAVPYGFTVRQPIQFSFSAPQSARPDAPAARPTGLLTDTLTDPGAVASANGNLPPPRAHRCKHGHRHHHRGRSSGPVDSGQPLPFTNPNALRPFEDARSNPEYDTRRTQGPAPPQSLVGNWSDMYPNSTALKSASARQSGYASDSTTAVRYGLGSRPQRPANGAPIFRPPIDFEQYSSQQQQQHAGIGSQSQPPQLSGSLRFFSPPLARASTSHIAVLPDQLYGNQVDNERARGQLVSPKADATPVRSGQPGAQPVHHLSTGSLNVSSQPPAPPTSLALNGVRQLSQLGIGFSPSRSGPVTTDDFAARANGGVQSGLPLTSPLAVVPPTPTQTQALSRAAPSQSAAQSSSSSSNATQNTFESDASASGNPNTNCATSGNSTSATRGATTERNSNSQLSSSSDSGYSHSTHFGLAALYTNVNRANYQIVPANSHSNDGDRRSLRNMAVFGAVDDCVSTDGVIPPPPTRSPPPPPPSLPPDSHEQRDGLQSDLEGAFASEISLNIATELNTLLNTVSVNALSVAPDLPHKTAAPNSLTPSGGRRSFSGDSAALMQPAQRFDADVSFSQFGASLNSSDLPSTGTPRNTSTSNNNSYNGVSGVSPEKPNADSSVRGLAEAEAEAEAEQADAAAKDQTDTDSEDSTQQASADADKDRYTKVVHVTVNKNPGLGFSIAGGVGSPGNPFREDDPGIFVTKVNAEGPAYGRLQVGDKILSVNGIEMQSLKHLDAVAVLKGTVTSAVNLIVERVV